ncbi:type 2 lanthipeptide synthetase LanM family protein [Bacillus pseudomycoides]|uniref:Type 2 lanthipeptide synthetase LanM family protein n=1 Tax=Bacillus bingmayongensis TaxID=1150157 RepID=A0ABU5JRG5_9BACI|nr:type 2 lanthipeptide synthetase LanM family protein [Bacillus pseudomycoides]
MSNAIHTNSVNASYMENFFTPFYNHLVDLFDEILKIEWKDLDSKRIDKQSVMLSVRNEFRKKLIDLTKKVLIYEFHDTFTSNNNEDKSMYSRIFNEYLEDRESCLGLLRKYPVLNDIYHRIQKNLVQNSYDLINRYMVDANELERLFNKKLGVLKSVSINLGDTHRNGNSVAIIQTENGKLIYKPRSLRADSLYSQVLSFFNQQCSETLKSPITLNKGDYGWQEYINPQDCLNDNDVEIYYEKLGMHLGFVYIFQGADFHYENIIAKGSDPYLIDLETLFQPTLDFFENDEKNKETAFIDCLNQTVYKSLFFNNTAYPEEELLRDACALSNTNEQLIEQEQIYNVGTDSICLKKEVQKMDKLYNLPSESGTIVEIFGYEKYFIDGFEKVYKFLIDNKKSILNILKYSEDFPVRVIIRPTHVYARFLTSLLHPKYLRESVERYRILAFFEKSYKKYSFFKKASKYEIADMYYGDIPYFTSLFKGTEVRSSNGIIINSKLIKSSTLEEIEKRFESLSSKDCSYQISLINMGLTALRANSNALNTKKIPDTEDYISPLRYTNVDDLIHRETEKIIDEGISFDNQIQWMSLFLHPNGRVAAGPLNYNLYDGIGGIGLYLMFYYNKFKVLDNTIIDSLLHTLKTLYDTTKGKNNYSAFHGLTSYIYILDKMIESGHVSKENAFEAYEEYCKKINKDLPSIAAIDFIGGLAGVLKVVSLLYKKYKLDFFKNTANAVFQQLVNKAHNQEGLLFWKFDTSKPYGLTGFSHGQTGICYAMSEYYTIMTSESEEKNGVLNTIQSALSYEDQFYNPDQKNWRDNRNGKFYSDPFWCHGAAGILLGRVKIQQNLGNDFNINYIKEALLTTLNLGSKHKKGNSLCHGTLGNIDILNEIKGYFNGEDLVSIESTIESWISNYLQLINNIGWQNGLNKDFSSPSFMMGKAGQLYALLRYKDPSIPCILTLS